MIKNTLLLLFCLLHLNVFASQKPPKVDYTDWNMVLKRFVHMDGNVDYKELKENVYILNSCLKKFSNTKIDNDWSTNENIAFWINVYNAFTLKLIVKNYPIDSIKDISSPWDQKFFKINGTSMSLGEVEHKILRKFGDPRIHFAINCASSSCPRIIQLHIQGKMSIDC